MNGGIPILPPVCLHEVDRDNFTFVGGTASHELAFVNLWRKPTNNFVPPVTFFEWGAPYKKN